MNIFSTPLHVNTEEIDKLIKLNKRLTKSQIKTFYYALPYNAKDRTSFEQVRTFDPNVTCFKDVEKYISYSLDNGFDFIYLLNSVKGFSQDKENFKRQQDVLDNLFNNLRKLKTYKVRVTDLCLVEYITRNYPDFEIYLSTSTEYTKITQFQNLLKLFPNIKELIPSYEVNRDFHLLKNLKNIAGEKTSIELIANEGCINGCPFRIMHPLSMAKELGYIKVKDFKLYKDNTIGYSNFCFRISDSDFNKYLCMTNIIFPWQIKYYNEIGYNNFKFVGRDDYPKQIPQRLSSIEYFLTGIEDENLIKDVPINLLINRYKSRDKRDYKIGVIKQFLPDIEFFIKNGKDCHYKCGTECTYCLDKAKKITEFFADKK